MIGAYNGRRPSGLIGTPAIPGGRRESGERMGVERGGPRVRIHLPPAASPVRTAIEPLAQYHRDHRRHRGQNRGAIATPRRDVAGGGEAGQQDDRVVRLAMPPFAHALRSTPAVS